jgi:hypothetical protein
VILVGQKAKDERTQYGQPLVGRPRLKVLAIAQDGRTKSLYVLCLQRMPLGALSADARHGAIRPDWAKPAMRVPGEGDNLLPAIR